MTSGSKSTKPLQFLPLATALALVFAAALAVRAEAGATARKYL